MTASKPAIIPCQLLEGTRARISRFAEALEHAGPTVGDHGMTKEEFEQSGLFRAAIERLRGTQAATTAVKRRFMRDVLDHLKKTGEIRDWKFVGSGERYDYEIAMPAGRISVVENKGCLDGNNTNIFQRPAQADEFIIWSLCQNPGADPRGNAWSGLHTRLGAEMISRREKVDAVIIWDMVCGTAGRPCPKLQANPGRATRIGRGRRVPPPCVYLMPRSVPDPRNNPRPRCASLEEVKLARALLRAFKGDAADVVEVLIEARMKGATVQRRTTFIRQGSELARSGWTSIRRARA